MWRSVLLGVILAGVLAGCSLGGENEGGGTVPARGSALSALITRHSLGGIELGESQAAVERLTGSGHKLNTQGVDEVAYAVPGGGLRIAYGSLFASEPQDAVLVASTDSPRFRTSEGVGVGSSLAEVKALGAMNCGPTDVRHDQCQTLAYGPGLEFDLTDGRVARVALVQRTN